MSLTNGRYEIGGVDALSIVDQFEAPLYVYDSATMKRQYKRMAEAFKQVKRLRINYACKALTNLNVLRIFRELGSGLDTVSIQEVQLGLMAGFDPHDILFTPNCVSLDEVEEAAAKGVRLNIDNISILEQFGAKHPDTPVCIRINPHIMAGGNSKISVGHIDSKFGISIHQVPHVLKVVKALGITVEGLHMHTGSDIYDAEVFLRAVEILLNAAGDFPDLDYLDFGSGFKVPYKPGGIATDIEDLGEKLSARFNEFCGEYGRELELMFEPGKFLVSESGHFLVRTNVVKTTTASVFAGVDSGLNHLIRPMFYDAHHEITNVSNPDGKPRIYSIVGYICETDTFGVNRQLAEVREGDILAMANAGAYSFMMASNYNSRYRPAEVLVYEGQAHLIRERETMEDLLRGQVAIPSLERKEITA
ncbi:diaminopimelate decarboxylase [Lewinella sp. 4G2]|uniref:diaminopimelate decarboxylase n=1 Tax=Lewinella sp. 4G2 TaxID=1803372 RepID=UPI0007B49CDC|nr:diaminopimelate decarboxylase [Lewinella sp. 4G2]